MAEHPIFFDNTLPNSEQAGMFAALFLNSLRTVSLQYLEGSAPLGTLEKLVSAPNVFWGVPRFLPGFSVTIDVPGDLDNPFVNHHVYFTMAEVKQLFKAQAEGLDLQPTPGLVEVDPHPDGNGVYSMVISLKCNLTFYSPEADDEVFAFVHFDVMTRQLNDSELHISVKYVRFLWL